MAGITDKKWGLFPPLSTALPSEGDLALNERMIDELKAQNNFEDTSETRKRTNVLGKFQQIAVEFVKHVGNLKGLSQAMINEAGGKISTFGSFRLGVYGPGSDIDTLLVAPKHVSRDDFFDHFPAILEKMSAPGAIEELKPVRDAFVPIIKIEYSGISIDLLFARLLLSSVPFKLDLKKDDLLRGLDEVEQRSLNGTRVSDQILSLVPQEAVFRQTLRTVKLWAQRRALYANIMGFPGGVAWAMMAANVCQSYPQACASVVVGKFFHLMGMWNWPRPVMLKELDTDPPGMQSKIWNPAIYRTDKFHLMPIITPAYPSMCATHNITRSTKNVIIKELKEAAITTRNIFEGKAQWKDLFEPHTFFTKDYKYYLSVVSASKTKDAQAIWSGLVESKVRRLVAGIEESQEGISIARPYVKGFSRTHKWQNEDQLEQVLRGSLAYVASDSKHTDIGNDATHKAMAQGNADLEMPQSDGTKEQENGSEMSTVYTTTYYVGIELAQGSKSMDISFSVSEFQRQCNMWPQYNEEVNSVRVVFTRNYDLPDDVFEPGDVRPSKAKKMKTGKNLESSKKRSYSQSTTIEEHNGESAKRRQPAASNNNTNG
ncbi:MAG: polynucleotide adenylyltransferase [Alyxoria varia]|nr:MAG: polynucleotide adenylyltransferase [Alyxoria varia]